MKTPTTSWPSSRRRCPATLLSTPPDIARTTRAISFLPLESLEPRHALIRNPKSTPATACWKRCPGGPDPPWGVAGQRVAAAVRPAARWASPNKPPRIIVPNAAPARRRREPVAAASALLSAGMCRHAGKCRSGSRWLRGGRRVNVVLITRRGRSPCRDGSCHGFCNRRLGRRYSTAHRSPEGQSLTSRRSRQRSLRSSRRWRRRNSGATRKRPSRPSSN